jgi:predicted SprT family Zn-dependent metalloprotease
MHMKKKLKEQVVQKFPYRCPYCDQPITYDQFNLKIGENEIKCPFCKKKYIKVVSDESPPPQSSPVPAII